MILKCYQNVRNIDALWHLYHVHSSVLAQRLDLHLLSP